MIEFVKHDRNPPTITSAGKVRYVSYAQAHDFGDGTKAFYLYPNGARVNLPDVGPQCMVGVGETPEKAWSACMGRADLVRSFGVEL